MIEFKDYQEKAIVKLKSEVNELLESQNDEVVISNLRQDQEKL